MHLIDDIEEAGGVYEMDLGPDSPIINLCQTFSYSPQLSVAASSTQLLTQVYSPQLSVAALSTQLLTQVYSGICEALQL